MSKRFTCSEKWNKSWFGELPPIYKLLWVYILDNCDIAGFWDVNFRLASFCIGENIDPEAAAKALDKQITIINGGKKWFVKDFIIFQYGSTENGHKIMISVKRLLSDNGFTVNPDTLSIEYCMGIDTLKDKEKEQDKDKEKEKGDEKIPPQPRIVRPKIIIPPAVSAFRDIMHRYPNKSLYAEIDQVIGQSPESLEFWSKVLKGWLLAGFNPMNLGGQLDCFKRKVIPVSKRPQVPDKPKRPNVRA